MNDRSSYAEANGVSAMQASGGSDWPITSCYIDAWALILKAWGLDPVAALGVTVTQDYEGDQFTFIKYQPDDLERLYGVIVGELTIYASLDEQIAEQTRMGRVVLAEADGYYLPDTRATSYRSQHVKTTVGIDDIDIVSHRLNYCHNTGYYQLSGEDYAGVFRKPPRGGSDDVLPPYVEFVKRRWPPMQGSALTDATVELLRRHLGRRPEQNPIRRYRQVFPHQMAWLAARPQCYHEYAFGNFRQLGANFQLLCSHLEWLHRRHVADLTVMCDAARHLSATAKALQFRVARIASRGRIDACEGLFDGLERDYETALGGLKRLFA